MAWTDLGINTGNCDNHNFTEYNGGLAWINSSHQVCYCNADGSGFGRIDAFTSANVGLPYITNFKGDLYITFWDTVTSGTCVYRYSGTGTTWNEVLRVDGLSLPRTGLACTNNYMVATICGDYDTDTWDVRKTSDGVNWSSVSKPSGLDWDVSGLFGSDFDNYIYFFTNILTETFDGDSFYSYMLDEDSSVNQGINIMDLVYFPDPPGPLVSRSTPNGNAACYYVGVGPTYNVYGSIDRGANWTLCFNDFYGFVPVGVGGVDFIVTQDENSPYHYFLSYHKYGDAVNNWIELEDSNSVFGGAGTPNGVARVGDVLYVHAGSKIYYSSTVIDWPQIPVPPSGNVNQMLQSISTPFNGGDYFWTTWLNDNVMQLHKRSLTDGQIVSTISLGTVTLADLTSGTHSAYVNAYDDDTVYVYGRMINPAGLTGTFQVIKTEEGGTGTWESIENGWGTDHCGALVLTGDNKVWAIRNGSTINLYGGTIAGSTLTQYSTLPLNEHVNRGGFTIAQNGNLFAASGVANSVMVVRSAPPYTSWSDITGVHAIDAGINRLVSFE